MRCQQCTTDISLEFTYAIQTNMCPKCGEDLMSAEKHQQYMYLIQDLKSVLQVTSDPNLNIQIANRVSNLLIENYRFKKTKQAQRAADPRKVSKPRPQPANIRVPQQPDLIVAEDDFEDDLADLDDNVTFGASLPRIGGPRGGGPSSGPRVSRVEGNDRIPLGSDEL